MTGLYFAGAYLFACLCAFRYLSIKKKASDKAFFIHIRAIEFCARYQLTKILMRGKS